MRAMRKKNAERREGDYYPSPPDAVLGLLDLVQSGFVPASRTSAPREAIGRWLKAAAQADIPVPDKGELSWRPHFTPRELSGSSPFQHYEWSVWTSMAVLRPRESGRYRRVLKPKDVPLWMIEEHARIGGIVA